MQTALETIQYTLGQIMTHMDKQFYTVNVRLDGIDAQFITIDQRFNSIDGRLDIVDKRLDVVDQQLGDIDERLDGMDQRLDGVDRRLNSMNERLDRLEFNQHEIRLDVNKRLKETAKQIDNLYNHMDGMLELYKSHDAEIVALQHVYEQHEKILEKL